MPGKINVLLTSFEQFYKYKYNPTISVSEKVEKILNNSETIDISTKVMQCKYSTIKQEVYDLYKNKPDIIISLGLGASRISLNLESVAQNEYNSIAPDNEGVIMDGNPIIQNGNNLFNSLNLKELEILSNKHVSSAVSDNAGKFMCNANFYWNQYKINNENLNTKYLFIHIPFTDEYIGKEPILTNEELPILSEKGIVNAIVNIFEELSAQIKASRIKELKI
tara:strand:- start:214 stop:879 length:666 start_codon:yes stop_codon:yes gene_type:complete